MSAGDTRVTTGFQVTFDAGDPEGLGRFWGQVLGYIEQPPPTGYASWAAYLDSIDVPADQRDSMYAVVDPDGRLPRLLFQRVPEGKTAKNRVHLDVNVGAGLEGDSRREAVRRARGLFAHIAPGESLVDELIAERREEARRESEEL